MSEDALLMSKHSPDWWAGYNAALHYAYTAALASSRPGPLEGHRAEWLDGVPTGFCECGKPMHAGTLLFRPEPLDEEPG